MEVMHGSRKFCQRGSNLFLVYEGKEDLNSTKSGPSSASASEMSFKWRLADDDDGPTLNTGLVAM